MNPQHLPITALIALFLLAGCASSQTSTEKAIIVPSAATSAPEYRGDGSVPAQRYVVRMSDGKRDWEIEFPEVAQGYEVRIPLGTDSVQTTPHTLTRADQELIDHLRRTDPDFERQGIYVDGQHALDAQAQREGAQPQPRQDSAPAPTRPSYLRGIDQVQRLFEAGQYETALLHLSELEEAYPNDLRIKSMKGTLWLRLGQEDLARKNWEQVLQIDPDNRPVQEALRRLDAGPDDFDED